MAKKKTAKKTTKKPAAKKSRKPAPKKSAAKKPRKPAAKKPAAKKPAAKKSNPDKPYALLAMKPGVAGEVSGRYEGKGEAAAAGVKLKAAGYNVIVWDTRNGRGVKLTGVRAVKKRAKEAETKKTAVLTSEERKELAGRREGFVAQSGGRIPVEVAAEAIRRIDAAKTRADFDAFREWLDKARGQVRSSNPAAVSKGRNLARALWGGGSTGNTSVVPPRGEPKRYKIAEVSYVNATGGYTHRWRDPAPVKVWGLAGKAGGREVSAKALAADGLSDGAVMLGHVERVAVLDGTHDTAVEWKGARRPVLLVSPDRKAFWIIHTPESAAHCGADGCLTIARVGSKPIVTGRGIVED